MGEWCYFKSHFSVDECDELVEIGLTYPVEDGTVRGQEIDRGFRYSDISWMKRGDPELEKYFQRIDACVAEANRKYLQVEYDAPGYDTVQFTTYRGGASEGNQYYNSHRDSDICSYHNPTQRKISTTVQLSRPGDYDGGVFNFHGIQDVPNPDDIKAQGTILVFHSLLYHSVSPVTRGTRHSLVRWDYGQPWR